MNNLNAAAEQYVRQNLHEAVQAISRDLRELADRIEADAADFDRTADSTDPAPYGLTASGIQKRLYTMLTNTRFHTLIHRAAEADVYRALTTDAASATATKPTEETRP